MSAAGCMSERLCRRYGAIPVRFLDDSTLQVAMVDPGQRPGRRRPAHHDRLHILPAIASEEDVFGAISKLNRLEDT